jgi:phosphoenolpyruvate phosphomutase
MRRLVRKLEQRGIAGVCIEDKLFPKTNSFIDGERQPLADIDEFCGKIMAGKDSQLDPSFCIVARIEALIAGWDLSEALRRAEAYRCAGADAILIHSKSTRPDQILAFAKEWAKRLPLVIVPTKYYSTPVEVFRKADISMVIWANHMIRAAVASMQAVAREILETESLLSVEDRIATVSEIFRLQGADELMEAERRYFASTRASTHAIVLAASQGRELAQLTDARPKVMLPIGGQPLLRWMVNEFKKQSINDITVVAGYRAEAIDVDGIRLTINADHAETGELASLVCAQENIADDMVIVYGDLLFRSYVLRDLLDAPGDIVAVVDSGKPNGAVSGIPDYAYCTKPDDRSLFGETVELQKICSGVDLQCGPPSGQWIGMLRLRAEGSRKLGLALNALRQREDFKRLSMADLLNYLVEQGEAVNVHYINGHWLDVNALEDVDKAGNFTMGLS